jgi:hypothetical protein
LIGNVDALKAIVRASGQSDRLAFQVTVTDAGTVRDVVVIVPKALEDSGNLRDAIEALKFCPAVKYNRDVSVKVNFDFRLDR